MYFVLFAFVQQATGSRDFSLHISIPASFDRISVQWFLAVIYIYTAAACLEWGVTPQFTGRIGRKRSVLYCNVLLCYTYRYIHRTHRNRTKDFYRLQQVLQQYIIDGLAAKGFIPWITLDKLTYALIPLLT